METHVSSNKDSFYSSQGSFLDAGCRQSGVLCVVKAPRCAVWLV
jgi:hypothetical protein